MFSNGTFYYTSDGRKFTNKTLGLLHAKKIQSTLGWYYYDDTFSKYDWKTEPVESLSQLYKLRAEQLRDNFKKISICFSGGYDSTNIIDTFLKNNIFIDEVIIVGAFSKDSHSGSDENHNGEIYHNAFPKLKELNLNTKVTIIDYTTLWDQLEIVRTNDADLLSSLNNHFSPHHWFWYQIGDFVKNKERTALIWGSDKPILYKKNNKIYQYFSDAAVCSYGFQGRLKQDQTIGTTNINFYSSIDCIPLIAKQCHEIKKTLERYSKIHNNNLLERKIFNIDDTEREKYIAKIIYPSINLNFKSPKSRSIYKSINFSLRDNFLLKERGTKVFNLYTKGIELRKSLSDSKIYLSKGYEIT